MRGLDPRIHADWPQIEGAAWIAGSSPATTIGEVLSPINARHVFVARYAAIASRRRRVTAGPKTPITTNTTSIAAAMKLNTPRVP